MPDIPLQGEISDDTNRWLGRAIALVEASDGGADYYRLKMEAQSLGMAGRASSIQTIKSILFNALAKAELRAPANAQGAFIPTGNSFDAYVAVGKIVQSADATLLIVDPYADEKVLTEFSLQSKEGVQINVLADAEFKKGTLRPAAERWRAQYGATRPLEVRLAASKSLHDRLVIADQKNIWVLGQSMNAMAMRAPTSIVKVNDVETVRLKLEAYASLWAAATPL